MVKRATWLSVTPEPERELPEAVATLAAGHRPSSDAVRAERERIEHLILHGGQRRWLTYLHRVVDLIERRAGTEDGDVERARARAAAVVANHHNLLLAHAGPGARLTADDRARLQELLTGDETRLAADDDMPVAADDHEQPVDMHPHPQEPAR